MKPNHENIVQKPPPAQVYTSKEIFFPYNHKICKPGANLVPIAVPYFCRKNLSSNAISNSVSLIFHAGVTADMMYAIIQSFAFISNTV